MRSPVSTPSRRPKPLVAAVTTATADADSNANARWFYDGIRAQGVRWDVTALSYYCMWHGSLANLHRDIVDLRGRYGKPVVIAETA